MTTVLRLFVVCCVLLSWSLTVQAFQAFVARPAPAPALSRTALGLWGVGKKASPKADDKPAKKTEAVAFGSSKPKATSAKPKIASVEEGVDKSSPLYQARRITRWIMFPGIFNDFDATEERQKKTIVIESKMSAKRRQELIDRNPEMYR